MPATHSSWAGLSIEVTSDRANPLSALHAIEAELGLQTRTDEIGYCRFGRWLVRPQHLVALLARRARVSIGDGVEIPALSQARASKLLHARFQNRTTPLRTGAQAVLAKRHIRSFYGGREPLTLKVLGHRRMPAEFGNELAARNALDEAGIIPLPPLRHSTLHGPHPFLCETLIGGRPLSGTHDARLIVETVLPRLWAVYEHFEPGIERAGDLFPAERMAADIERFALPPGTLDASWKFELCGALMRLRDRLDQGTLTGFGHGDLSPDNMILARDGRVFIVDWETAGRMPLLWDCRKLLYRVTGATRWVRSAYDGAVRGIGGEMLEAHTHLVLVAVRQVADRISRIGAWEHADPRSRRGLLAEIALARRLIDGQL
jgi:hypothetical protein